MELIRVAIMLLSTEVVYKVDRYENANTLLVVNGLN